jgi:hypothetical protein
MAAAMSIQCSKRPPIKLLRVLVSLGNTSSFITVNESFGLLTFILIISAKVRKNEHTLLKRLQALPDEGGKAKAEAEVVEL